MAEDNFKNCLPKTLAREGGYTNDPRDPGNWTKGKVGQGELKGTNKGISAASYPTLDIKNLTMAQISDIYELKYWKPVHGDDVPVGSDLSLFDYGVQSGPFQSIKDAQRVSGAGVDGKMGPETIRKVNVMDPVKFIKSHQGRRLSMYKSLAIWNTFGKGLANRVAAIEAAALAMVMTKTELQKESDAANTKSNSQTTGAVVLGGGAATDQATNASPDQFAGVPDWCHHCCDSCCGCCFGDSSNHQ